MEPEFLLTVGIPVYNGERFIRQTLESLKVAAGRVLDGKVEFLISDNCSTDNTASIADEYQQSGNLKISCFRNEKNQGYDRNIDLIVERARGKYVWFLGCGEIAKPDSLKTICQKLHDHTYDYVLLNFDIYSEKTGMHDFTRALPCNEDLVLHSLADVYDVCTGIGTALSSNVVLKSAWDNVKSDSLLEKGWCHIERINKILTSKEPVQSLIIAEACFTLYRELDGWWTTELFYINFLSYYRIIRSLRTSLSSWKFRKLELKIYPLSLISSILVAKKMGVKFNKALISLAIKEFSSKITFWLLVFPLFFIPNTICQHRYFVHIAKKGSLALNFIKAKIKQWPG